MERELFVKSKAGFNVEQTKLRIAFVKRMYIQLNIYCLLFSEN